jgi:Zn-dependent protease
LIPIPPLDGSRLVRAILPENLKRYWEDFEKYMPFVLIFILFIPGSPISSILGIALNFLLKLFTGVSYF